MPSIVVLKAGDSSTHELTHDETVIGRLPECQIQIDSNMVSRKHAKIVRDGGGFCVEDMESGNGTTLNGVKVQPRVRTPLKHDDRIKLGPILLRFLEHGPVPNVVARPAGESKPETGQTSGTKIDFNLNEDDEESAMITGAVGGEASSRFGALDVQPAAKLKGILEISRTLAGTVDLNALLPKILDTLFVIFPGADRGCILLKDGAEGQMVPRAIKHRRPGEDDSVKLSRTIVNKVLSEKRGILSADASSDSQFQASESIANLTIRSMMCVPLLGLDGEPLGIINIDTQNPVKRFQTDDLDLLLAVAGQAALSYENARLVASYAEKVIQDNEMRIAQGVQRALLPESLPKISGYDFFAAYESAQAVGGDFYDCFPLPGGRRLVIAFGDVAGKGVPAALVVSRLSSAVQSTMEFVPDVGEALAKINDHMCAHAVEGRFVTFTLVIIDIETHEMTLAIAGHMSPIVRKVDGSYEEFPEEAIGLPLGVVGGMPYDVLRRTLQPGETVVLYTDGVSEAMNPGGDLYTPERLRELIIRNSPDPTTLGKLIRDDVRKHANGRPQNDDITLMVFGRAAT
ncbi:MAG: SpoIIE family protein phosphatase [Planctomycetes bacterium]|nr:SpoIIE family protein phosphatase [Planctomycetota bacterium]